jgi:hypothetical protein
MPLAFEQSAARWAAYAVAVLGVLGAGWWVQRKAD